MRVDSLNLFICPGCKSGMLELSVSEQSNAEIISGDISCKNCGKNYGILEGITELILPTEQILKEEKFYINELNETVKNDKSFIENREEFVLALPNIDKNLCTRPHIINYFVTQGQNFYFILDKLKPKQGELVLDIGAGKCWASAEFTRRGCNVFALEILKEKYLGLKTAQIYIDKENLFFERMRADMSNLPFKDKAFDIVFFNSSLHHGFNIDKSIGEAARVLKDNGRLVFLNEPVKGVFRRHEYLDELKENGLNENAYYLMEYADILSKYNIKFTTFFPASFDKKLRGWAKNGGFFRKTLGCLYAGIFAHIVSNRAVKTTLHALFGMGLNAIGVKKTANK